MAFTPPSVGGSVTFAEHDAAMIVTAAETIAANNNDTTVPTSSAVDAHVLAVSINNLVEDTTPQFGGDVDMNGQSIVTLANADINLAPHGTGAVVLSDGTSLKLQEAVQFTSTVSGVNQILIPDNIDGDALAFKDDGGGGTIMRFKTANGFEEITFYSNSKFDAAASLVIGGNIGFYNTAASSKKTVTGAHGSNAALQSLLTQLAAYGLIVDSSS